MTEPAADLSLPALGALLAVIMAVLAVTRGLLRLIRGVVALTLGLIAGTAVFLKAPQYLEEMGINASWKWLAGLSVVGGAVGHLGSQFVLGKLLGGMNAAQVAGMTLSKGKAALASLLPSGFLMWAGGIIVRLTGSLSGMEHVDAGQRGDWPWLARARETLSQGVLGGFFNATDPVTSPETLRLCEILVTYRVKERFQQMGRDPAYKAVMANPVVQRLLADREVKLAVAHSNYARLLTLPEVREAASQPEVARALRALPEAPIPKAEPVP